MICASQQIIKNEELAKMAIFKKSGWKDGMIMGAWTNSHDLLMPFNFSLVTFFQTKFNSNCKRSCFRGKSVHLWFVNLVNRPVIKELGAIEHPGQIGKKTFQKSFRNSKQMFLDLKSIKSQKCF